MLAKANRITRGIDYKKIVRRGSRHVSPNTVTYVMIRKTDNTPPRFGFIVTKSIGNSVIRNRVRRRLKAAAHSLLPQIPPTSDVIVRALPGAVSTQWSALREEIFRAIQKTSDKQ